MLSCFLSIVWVSVMPYVSLISTKIIDYQQLAILFSCVPAISILTPIITGKFERVLLMILIVVDFNLCSFQQVSLLIKWEIIKCF